MMVSAILAAATAPSLIDQLQGILGLIVVFAAAAVVIVAGLGYILKQFQGSKDETAAKADAKTAELIEALQGRTNLQDKELIELRARVTHLETTLASKDAEINHQKGELSIIRAENDRLRARNGDLEIRVDRMSERMGDLNAALNRRTRATDTTPYQGPDRRGGQEEPPADESEVPRAI